MNRILTLILAPIVAVSLGACVEDSGETVEKQAYKGASDMLVAGNADERAQVLSERFKKIQTDR